MAPRVWAVRNCVQDIIWLCLIATLLVALYGQALLFPLTPIPLGVSLGGHLIYGTTRGLWLTLRMRRRGHWSERADFARLSADRDSIVISKRECISVL